MTIIPDLTRLYIESLYEDVVSIIYDKQIDFIRIIIYTKCETIFIYYDHINDSLIKPEYLYTDYEIFVRKHKIKKLLE